MTSGTPTRMAAWLESAWLARYLDRQLEGEELAWFEGYLLDKPELVEMMEADTLMRDAVASCSIDTSSDNARRRPLSAMSWAIAASLLAGIGIGAMAVHRPAQDPVRGDWIVNPTRAVFDTLRGSEQSIEVERSASDSPYVLVEVAVPPTAQDVVLESGGGVRARLILSADGFVSFLIARSAFRASAIATVRYVVNGEPKATQIPLNQIVQENLR